MSPQLPNLNTLPSHIEDPHYHILPTSSYSRLIVLVPITTQDICWTGLYGIRRSSRRPYIVDLQETIGCAGSQNGRGGGRPSGCEDLNIMGR